MLWYQGEADTMKREDAELYQGRMEAFVRDVRRDLGRPDLLVIQVLSLIVFSPPFLQDMVKQ
jgi:hypothetical protein